jgi:hypothetical protein
MMRDGVGGAAELLDGALGLRLRQLAAVAPCSFDLQIWQDLSAKVLKSTADIERNSVSTSDPASVPDVVVQAATLALASVDGPARWTEIAEFDPMSDSVEEVRSQIGAGRTTLGGIRTAAWLATVGGAFMDTGDSPFIDPDGRELMRLRGLSRFGWLLEQAAPADIRRCRIRWRIWRPIRRRHVSGVRPKRPMTGFVTLGSRQLLSCSVAEA